MLNGFGDGFAFLNSMYVKSISLILGTIFCLASIQGGAESLPPVPENPFASKSVCEMRAEDFLEKSRITGNLSEPSNIAGPLKTGLCWWHSKLQRAAIYLAVFDRPTDPRPTSEEAKQIFTDLTRLNKVISIPGFRDWYSFTFAFRMEFYEVLGDWEISQSTQFEFVKGLRAPKETDSSQLQKISREVNEYKRVTFVLLKMPYLAAHAWLVSSVSGEPQNFEMSFLDSKFSSSLQSYKSKNNSYVIKSAYPVAEQTYEYDTSNLTYPQSKGLVDPNGVAMSMYLQNDNSDFLKIIKAIRELCGGETDFTLHEKQVRADKEKRAFEQTNWWRPGTPHN